MVTEKRPLPSAGDVSVGAAMLKEALMDTTVDAAEAKRIFYHFDRSETGVLSDEELESVVLRHTIQMTRV